jgi:UDP-N-acetylglucosamine:LPS N-acetylglucosamine transferase
VLAISSLSEKNGQKLVQEGAAGYFEKGSMTPEKLENAVSEILKKRLLVPNESDVKK